MKTRRPLLLIVVVLVLLLVALMLPATSLAKPSSLFVPSLEPTWDAGVYSAYYGPPDYDPVSPGSTAWYLGSMAGIIKAGLAEDPGGGYWDEGLFAFKPNATIEQLGANPLVYRVVNQYGTNPVWMTMELDVGVVGDRSDNITYQFVPAPYGSDAYNAVDAGAGMWLQWGDGSGSWFVGDPMTLAEIATAYPDVMVVRAYLRLGMGDSYAGDGQGTVAWVDEVSIAGTTYDFVVRGKGFYQKDWSTNPGHRAHYIQAMP